jgi:hypothetical protein
MAIASLVTVNDDGDYVTVGDPLATVNGGGGIYHRAKETFGGPHLDTGRSHHPGHRGHDRAVMETDGGGVASATDGDRDRVTASACQRR